MKRYSNAVLVHGERFADDEPPQLSREAKALLREAGWRQAGWPVDYVDTATRETLDELRSLDMIDCAIIAGDLIYSVADEIEERELRREGCFDDAREYDFEEEDQRFRIYDDVAWTEVTFTFRVRPGARFEVNRII